MAKTSGLAATVSVDNSAGSLKDISIDVGDFDISLPQNLLDVTGVSKSAFERIIGLGDGTITLNGFFDSASNLAHDVFKTRTGVSTTTIVLYVSGSSDPQISMECLVANYNISRGSDGSLTWNAVLQLQDGTVPVYSTS